MIVSHQHRFIFLKTMKTAGTSMEIALSRFCGPDDIVTPISPDDELLRVEAGGVGPQNHQTDPPSYAHMRARAVRRVVGGEVWNSYFRFAVERNPWEVVASSYRFSCRKPDYDVPFSEFVRSERVPRLAENAKIYRIGEKIAVDVLYRYEDLQAAVLDIAARCGLPPLELPHAKRSSGPHYRDLYGPGEPEIVAAAFADVIDHLGYEF